MNMTILGKFLFGSLMILHFSQFQRNKIFEILSTYRIFLLNRLDDVWYFLLLLIVIDIFLFLQLIILNQR